MQFQVPQFIEQESRVVGPLTFRQFIFLAIAGAGAFALYFLAPFFIFTTLSLGLGALGLLAAFVQVGGKSLPAVFLDFLNFHMGGKFYYWKKRRAYAPSVQQKTTAAMQPVAPQATATQITLSRESKLGKLSTKIGTF